MFYLSFCLNIKLRIFFKAIEPSSSISASIAKLALNSQQKQQEILKSVEQPFIPKDPPTEFEFIADPPSISALDL